LGVLSDSQIARTNEEGRVFEHENDNKGVKRIRTAKRPAVVADLQDPDNRAPPACVTLLQAAEWAEELSRSLQEQSASFEAGSQSRFQINYVDRMNRLLVLSMISGCQSEIGKFFGRERNSATASGALKPRWVMLN